MTRSLLFLKIECSLIDQNVIRYSFTCPNCYCCNKHVTKIVLLQNPRERNQLEFPRLLIPYPAQCTTWQSDIRHAYKLVILKSFFCLYDNSFFLSYLKKNFFLPYFLIYFIFYFLSFILFFFFFFFLSFSFSFFTSSIRRGPLNVHYGEPTTIILTYIYSYKYVKM